MGRCRSRPAGVVPACCVVLAVVVVVSTLRGGLAVEASIDLLGPVGTLLAAGGAILNYVTDFVVADRRFTVLGLRVAAPWWMAGLICLAASGYLLR